MYCLEVYESGSVFQIDLGDGTSPQSSLKDAESVRGLIWIFVVCISFAEENALRNNEFSLLEATEHNE